MNLGNQRAGGVNGAQAESLGPLFEGKGHTMGTEDSYRTGGDLFKFFDKDGTTGSKFSDNMGVVYYFVEDIDGRIVAVKGLFDNGNGPVNSGAESAWLGKDDFHSSFKKVGSHKKIIALSR